MARTKAARISAEEQGLLAQTNEPMSDIVPPMYDALLKASERLSKEVIFLDGTRAFQGHQETIYKDACCHFNLRGYDLLVEDVLGPWLKTFKPAGSGKATENGSPGTFRGARPPPPLALSSLNIEVSELLVCAVNFGRTVSWSRGTDAR
jgi:hypothetical protein